jgi:hypothetical protein
MINHPAALAIVREFPNARITCVVRTLPGAAHTHRETTYFDCQTQSAWQDEDDAAVADDFYQSERDREQDRQAVERVNRVRQLPATWQCDITGADLKTAGDVTQRLIEAVSPSPELSAHGRSYLCAINIMDDCAAKRRSAPEWARRVVADGRAERAFYRGLEQQDKWCEARRKERRRAFWTARHLARIDPIPTSALKMIDKDDDFLRGLAEERAAHNCALSLAKNMKLRAEIPSSADMHLAPKMMHPRELHAATHLRRLRAIANRTSIWASANLRLIGGRKQHRRPEYADDWTLSRFYGQVEANENWAADHDIIDEAGVRVPLDVVIRNADAARRSQWYAMTLGLAERAKRERMIAVFVTCTLPGQYHANPAKGANSHNPEFSPTVGAEELCRRWSRVRARFQKSGVRYFGIRTIEPHSDGTPHYHFQLWVAPDDYQAFFDALDDHFNDGRRIPTAALKIKIWKGKGAAAAASYVMHYVMKALHRPRSDVPESAQLDRARAWMKHVGVRRIALIGLAKGAMGRWQAAYRLVRETEPQTCSQTRKLVRAMRKRQWASALALAGAFRDQEVYVTVTETVENRWGDPVKKTVAWAVASTGEIALFRRPKIWVITERKTETAADAAVSVRASSPRGGHGPPIPRSERWLH